MVRPSNVYLKTSIHLVAKNTAEVYLLVLDGHTFLLASELSSVGDGLKAESLAKSEERTHKQINTPLFHGLWTTSLSCLKISVCQRAVIKVGVQSPRNNTL